MSVHPRHGCETFGLVGCPAGKGKLSRGWQRIQRQFLRWEMLRVVRQEGEIVSDGNRGYRRIRNRERRSLLGEVSLHKTRHSGDGPGHVVVRQALEEFFRRGFFLRTHTSIDLSDIDRATGEKMALFKKPHQEVRSAAFAV